MLWWTLQNLAHGWRKLLLLFRGGCNDFFLHGIRRSEGLFLMSTQNYFLFYARDKTEKHLCLVHYRAQIKLSYRSIELMFTDAK